MSKKKILLVDDDRLILAAHKRSLGTKYAYTEARTAEEGFVIGVSQEFDLIISDNDTKSKMNGLQMIRNLRIGGHEEPIILLSGSLSEETIAEAIRNNAIPLQKPVSSQHLHNVIIDLLK